MLGLFCKNPLNAVLRGVTCTNIDPSVDHVKASMIPVLKKFVLDDEDLDLKITKRGLYLFSMFSLSTGFPINLVLMHSLKK